MADHLPLHDLEGRDVQAPVNAEKTENRKGHGEHGRILLSMVGSDGTTYYAAIPIPASYMVSPIRP